MAATADDLRRNIEPGSIPFGQRQALESQLGGIGQGVGGPAAVRTPQDAQLGIPSNPLDPLLGGEIPTNGDEVTAGLSVGPGPGPNPELPDSRIERLRMVAAQARSPVLRELARRALASTVRTRRGR